MQLRLGLFVVDQFCAVSQTTLLTLTCSCRQANQTSPVVFDQLSHAAGAPVLEQHTAESALVATVVERYVSSSKEAEGHECFFQQQ